VRVKVIKDKPNYYIGEVIEIVKPAKERINPPCTYFNQCGGCDYQHIKYQSQLKFKEEILVETLKRVGGLKEISINPIIPSPEPFYYRLKAQLKIVRNSEHINLGYYRKDSHRFVPIKECIICHKQINNLIKVFLELKEANLLYNFDEIEIILSNLTKKILLSTSGNNINKTQLAKLSLAIAKKIKNIAGILTSKKRKIIHIGKTFLSEKIKEINYRISSESFFQINYSLHDILLNEIIKFVNPKKKENIFDIYCGVGTFSLPIALKANYIFGIDESTSSISDAIFNQRTNRIKNCEFIQTKAEDGLKLLKKKRVLSDTILINPPRAGCTKMTKKLIASFIPQNIIYLSCNPSTLARDLSFFLKKHYEIKTIQPIDQFPQTYHIETLVKLERVPY